MLQVPFLWRSSSWRSWETDCWSSVSSWQVWHFQWVLPWACSHDKFNFVQWHRSIFQYIYFAQIAPELPHLHQVKSLRKVLNMGVELSQLPSPVTGYYLYVRVLTTAVLSSLVSVSCNVRCNYDEHVHAYSMQLKNNIGLHRQQITLKLLGDGTQLSSTLPMVFFTLSFPDLGNNVLSASGIHVWRVHIQVLVHVHTHIHACTQHVGNHTYAAVWRHETYEFLWDCFAPVWSQVADLTHNPIVCMDGRNYTLQGTRIPTIHVHTYMYMLYLQYLLLTMGWTMQHHCILASGALLPRRRGRIQHVVNLHVHMYMYMYSRNKQLKILTNLIDNVGGTHQSQRQFTIIPPHQMAREEHWHHWERAVASQHPGNTLEANIHHLCR